MSLFSQKDQGRTILILDVQSSVVRASVVIIGKTGVQPHVAFTTNAVIPYKPHTDSSYLIKVTLRAVSEVVDAAMRFIHVTRDEGIPQRISSIHFALSSPWIVSQAKTLSVDFPKPSAVTRPYVMKMIDDERAKLAPEAGDTIRVIEEKIFDVRLNGYSVGEWENKPAARLQVSYTVSIAGTRMIERFVTACGHATRPTHVFFHSSLMLQHIGYQKLPVSSEDYALIHAHGELTDAAIVHGHACVFFGSYPTGVRTIVRKIAAASCGNEQAAESLFTLYTGGHLDPSHGKADLDTVNNIAAGWASELRKMLASESSGATLPHSIVVVASAHDDFFSKLVAETYPKSHVALLSIEDIQPMVTFVGHADRRRLTGLYALALAGMHDSGSL